jgi:polysaccharide biosynthesis protein PslE
MQHPLTVAQVARRVVGGLSPRFSPEILMQAALWNAVREAAITTWRRRVLCAALFGATLCAVAALWTLAPRSYISEAKLFVRVGRETVTLDPTATTGQTIAVYEARETELNSLLDVMSSRAVREMVVDRMGTGVVLGHLPVPLDDPNQPPIAVNPDRDNGQAFISSFFPPEFRQFTKGGKRDQRATTRKPATRPRAATPVASQSNKPVPPAGNDDSDSPSTQAVDRSDSKARELAIQSLAKIVRVNVGKKSGVVTLEARAESPELAQRILRTTLDCFLVQHLRINRNPGSHRFFLEQVDLTRKDLEGATNSLRDVKNRLGVVSVEGHRKLVQDRMAQLETARLDAETSLAAGRASVAELTRSIQNFPATLVSAETTGSPNDATDRARQQLQDLELRERDLLVKYTISHPAVAAIRDQADRARSILEERRTDGRSQRTQGINPAAQQMQLRLAEEESKVAALEARVVALRDKSVTLRDELETLNANEAEIQQLEKKVEISQASLKSHTEKLEQARIDQALEDGRISNVNVVQPASYSETPASPSAKLVFLLGGVLAVCNGFGLPFAWDFLRRVRPLVATLLAGPAEGTPAS